MWWRLYLLLWAALLSLPTPAGANVLVSRDVLRGKTVACKQQSNQQTFLTSQTWNVPANVTSLDVVAALAAGAGGGNGAMNAGGGGEYRETDNLPVTPGNPVTITVGQAGQGGAQSASSQAGTNGGNSSVVYGGSTIVLANGGQVGTTF